MKANHFGVVFLLLSVLFLGGNIGSFAPLPQGTNIKWKGAEDAAQTTGACIWVRGLSSECTSGVTRQWCDQRNGNWRAGSSFPR